MSDPQPPTHVALVGHCGFDGSSLTRLAKSALPDAEIVAVNHQKDLDTVAHGQALLLINRVLDGRFDAESSVSMIEQLAERDDAPAMMLISNYPDAQAQAEAAGALPGFGKSDLGRAEITERLRDLKL
ncbi:MAG: hypothetical protein AAGJ38_09655 [Planctomycetota bacterium]